MTKKVSMKAYFSSLSNGQIQQCFAIDGFDVKVVNQKSSGVWVKFKDKADASMFILRYDTMANYVNQLEVQYPWFEMRPYQKQMMGRVLRSKNTNIVMAGRRTGKSMMTKQYFDDNFDIIK